MRRATAQKLSPRATTQVRSAPGAAVVVGAAPVALPALVALLGVLAPVAPVAPVASASPDVARVGAPRDVGEPPVVGELARGPTGGVLGGAVPSSRRGAIAEGDPGGGLTRKSGGPSAAGARTIGAGARTIGAGAANAVVAPPTSGPASSSPPRDRASTRRTTAGLSTSRARMPDAHRAPRAAAPASVVRSR